MSSFIPGQGMKKPLNMLETPIYPDIRAQPPLFKDAGKYWTVDVGQTLLDTETNTQLRENAILAQSRDYNRDHYGHTSYQEKIAVFRPPLQSSYEDFGPLNRLPTSVHAIQPRINPGTAHGGQGTGAFFANNESKPETDKFITDKITTNHWKPTYYIPMSAPEHGQDIVMPDFESVLPLRSVGAGSCSILQIDAPDPRQHMTIDLPSPAISIAAGHNSSFSHHIADQTNVDYELKETNPSVSGSSGYVPTYYIDGETQFDSIELSKTTPSRSATAGHFSQTMVDGDVNRDYNFSRTLPSTPVSSGSTFVNTIDGETRLSEMSFKKQLDVPTVVINPSSEHGYMERTYSLTTPEEHMKLRQRPKVSASSNAVFSYKERNDNKNLTFRQKLQPLKHYDQGLDRGTVKTSGVSQPQIKLKSEHLRTRKRM